MNLKKGIGRNICIGGLFVLTASILGLLSAGCEIDSVYLDSIEKQIEEDLGTGATYKVTYFGNGNDGGTVPTDETLYSEGQSVTVKGQGTLSLTGATFTGWNTLENGNGTDYVVDSSFPMPAENVYLYAQWTTNLTYTVTYDGNGSDVGTVPTDSNNYEEDDSVTVSGPGTMGLIGYNFTGWLLDGTGITLNGGDTYEMGTSNITLIAQWEFIPTFTVTYVGTNADGGTVPVDSNDYEEDDWVIVADPTSGVDPLYRTGYSFNAWNSEELGGGISHAASSSFQMGITDITLYAQWTQLDEYEVSFNSQGGTGVTLQNIIDGGLVVEPVAPTRVGYTFGGWFKESECINEWNFLTDTVTVDRVLWAKWTERDFIIGEIGPAGGTVFYDKGSYSNGWRYLEAAPASTEWSGKQWGGYMYEVGAGAQGATIGTGAANTAAIVSVYGDTEPKYGLTDYAAKLCADLSFGGYDDWFLPSKDELIQMYSQRSNIGGFSSALDATALYWSSSESSESSLSEAYRLFFYNGLGGDFEGYFEGSVRTVGSF